MSPTSLGLLVIHIHGRAPMATVTTKRLRDGRLEVTATWAHPGQTPMGLSTKLAPGASPEEAGAFAETVGQYYDVSLGGPVVVLTEILPYERTQIEVPQDPPHT